jgi:hypothetical protein
MKNIILVLTLLLVGLTPKPVEAQVQFGINVNIGSQPVWGPVGYDYVENYYLPDIDVFYNVRDRQYIYLTNGQWNFSNQLPQRYNNYNIYNGYKVVVNKERPYRYADNYRREYASYKDRHDQPVIRNSHENKYFENKNHPEHDKWNNGNGNGNGNKRENDNKKDNGKGKGHGKD